MSLMDFELFEYTDCSLNEDELRAKLQSIINDSNRYNMTDTAVIVLDAVPDIRHLNVKGLQFWINRLIEVLVTVDSIIKHDQDTPDKALSENKLSVHQRVINCICKQAGLTLDQLVGSFDQMGLDSLDKIEIVMGLEEEFEIEILDTDARKLMYLTDVTKLIRTKLNEA